MRLALCISNERTYLSPVFWHLRGQLFNVGIQKVGTHFGGDFYVGGSKCRQFQKVGGFKMAVVQIGGSGNNVGSCNSIVGQLVVATNSSGVATT